MLNKKLLLPLILFTLTPTLMADSLSDDKIKKALEDITEIIVMASDEPKVISEVKIKNKEVTVKKKSHKKSVPTKRVDTKKVHKKVHHKRKAVQQEALNDLPMAKTLGVVETSKVFTGKY